MIKTIKISCNSCLNSAVPFTSSSICGVLTSKIDSLFIRWFYALSKSTSVMLAGSFLDYLPWRQTTKASPEDRTYIREVNGLAVIDCNHRGGHSKVDKR